MSKFKVMLDSNIFFDFALIESKTTKNVLKIKKLKQSVDIYIHFINQRFDSCITNWNIFELRDILNKFILGKSLLKEGFALEEFAEAKDSITLTKRDFKIINEFIEGIKDFSTIEFCDLDIKFVEKLTKKGFSFMDSILVSQADDLLCNYFVTRDNRLRKDLDKNNIKLKKVKVTTRKDFLSRIN